MEKRIIFPTLMFALAVGSFGFGIWQYAYAQSTQASATKRMAYIMTTIEDSSVARPKKQELYASIMGSLPAAPSMFGIDFSGSFASTGDDQCTSEGQRSICRALKDNNTDLTTQSMICGVCNPK